LNFSKFILYSTFFIYSWSFLSCSSDKNEKLLKEGQIEYTAAVVDENHPLAGLAPGAATIKFKDSRLIIEMSTMGIFNTSFISNPHKKTLVQLVKCMDMKNACIQTETDLDKASDEYRLVLTDSKRTKTIAGYVCKCMMANPPSNPADTFAVYYTEQIAADSINFLSPYRQIKGMMMDYRLKKLGIEMHFTATSVKKEEIPETTFDIPSYYKIVTRQEMEQVFADILK